MKFPVSTTIVPDLFEILPTVAKEIALRTARSEYYGGDPVSSEREAEALAVVYGMDDRKVWQQLSAKVDELMKWARRTVRAKRRAEAEAFKIRAAELERIEMKKKRKNA